MGNKSGHHTEHNNTDLTDDGQERNRDPYQQTLQQLYKTLTTGSSAQDDIKSYFSNLGEGIQLPALGEILGGHLLVDPASEERCLAVFTEEGSTVLQLANSAEQLKFYISLFSRKKEHLSQKDAESLLDIAYKISLYTSGLYSHHPVSDVIPAIIKSAFQGRAEEGCPVSSFTSWCSKHLPYLTNALHAWVVSSLLGQRAQVHQVKADSLLPGVTAVLDHNSMLNLPTLWALSSTLPRSYIHSETLNESPGASAVSHSGHPLALFVEYGGWSLLYSSNNQGLSLNRFQHHVFDYKEPTLMLLKFDQHVYCISADKEWKESTERWGDIDCRIIQVLPQFKVVQASSGILYLNTQSRKVPKGFQFGNDPKTLILQIDEGMSKVKHYGVEIPLHKVEVWGCGSVTSREKQLQQKKWEHQQAEKEKQRKLKIEDWKDNPDRQLLDWGGVQTEHAER